MSMRPATLRNLAEVLIVRRPADLARTRSTHTPIYNAKRQVCVCECARRCGYYCADAKLFTQPRHTLKIFRDRPIYSGPSFVATFSRSHPEDAGGSEAQVARACGGSMALRGNLEARDSFFFSPRSAIMNNRALFKGSASRGTPNRTFFILISPVSLRLSSAVSVRLQGS